MNFFSSTKFVFLLILLSAGLIAYGVYLINQAPAVSDELATNSSSVAGITVIEQTEEEKLLFLAREAEAILRDSLQENQGTVSLELSKEHAKEIREKFQNNVPAVGTEDWCDYMMIKPNEEWTQDDKGQFAKNCI